MTSLGTIYYIIALTMLFTAIFELVMEWPLGWKGWLSFVGQVAFAFYYFHLSRTSSSSSTFAPPVEDEDILPEVESLDPDPTSSTPIPQKELIEIELGKVRTSPIRYTLEDLREKLKSSEWKKSLEKAIEKWKELKLLRYATLIREAERTTPPKKDSLTLTSETSYVEALTRAQKLVLRMDPVRKATSFSSVLSGKHGLESLIGRKEVISEILSNVFAFAVDPRYAEKSFPHLALLGSSGTGKTKLASVIARVYSSLGLLATPNVTFVTRSDLVAEFIGQTGPRTRHVLFNTLEGILFLDEAYSMGGGRDNGESIKDYGSESIAEMVNFLDKTPGCSMMIVAGYPDKMERDFFETNEGLRRRFPTRIRLNNFSSAELTSLILRELTFVPTQEEANWIYALIRKLSRRKKLPGQAGDAIELAASLSRSRTLGEGSLVAGANDFLRSRGISVEGTGVKSRDRDSSDTKDRATTRTGRNLVDSRGSSSPIAKELNPVLTATISSGGRHGEVTAAVN